MKRSWVIILVFVGVFICGGVAGGAISIHYYERFVREKGADRFLARELREIGDKLELTAQQKKEIRTIFLRSVEEQRSARKQIDVIMERMLLNMEKVLTPEQLAKFKEHRAQQRARRLPGTPDGGPGFGPFRERRERDRPPRPEGAPPAPPAPPTEPSEPTSSSTPPAASSP